MPESLGEQAVQVEWKVTRVTTTAFIGLIQQLLKQRDQIGHGQQSLKRLNLQGKKLEQVEIPGEDVRALRRELNRHAVDFSITRGVASHNYMVYFKAQDVDRVYTGLQRCVKNLQERDGKKSVREVMKEAYRRAEDRVAGQAQSKKQERGRDER